MQCSPLVTEAHKIRLQTTKPKESHFRVVSIIAYQHPSGLECKSVGCNVELSSSIGNSVCAERCALYRMHAEAQNVTWPIKEIVVVTDAEDPLACGALCRELLRCAADADTPVILSGAKETFLKTTVDEMFPALSPYAKLDVDEQLQLGVSLQGKLEVPASPFARTAYHAAESAALSDSSPIHPIRYGAAVIYEDGTVLSAHQLKGTEYSCTIDAVRALIPLMLAHQGRNRTRPVALCQADQFGIAHAPFGAARALLREHFPEASTIDVITHTAEGKLLILKADQLIPDIGASAEQFAAHLEAC